MKLTNASEVIEVLKHAVEASGKSVAELERELVRAGYRVTGLHGWLNGRVAAPRLDQVLAVLDVLGYDVELVRRDDE